MAVFSVTALDRLIDADRKSSSSSSNSAETPPKQQQQQHSSIFRPRRPVYKSYAFSSNTPPPSPPPARTRSASPTSFSPSPYVVNHKRRVPNGSVDAKRNGAQQNGFSVSESRWSTRPSESHELVSSKSGKEQSDSQRLSSPKSPLSQPGEKLSAVRDQIRSPRRSLDLQLDTKAAAASNGTDSPLLRKAISDATYLHGHVDVSEQNGKWEGVEVAEKRDMSVKSDDSRGKQILEDRSYEGSSSSRDGGSASRSAKIVDASRDYSRTTSSSSSDEWFDAPEGLSPAESFSDDESRRSASPGSSFKSGPDTNIYLQLKIEVQKRVAAEEAREALRQQRDGIVQMLTRAGISVPQSDLGGVNSADIDKFKGVYDSLTEKIMVARYVAGAVVTGAVRAEAEAELQTVLAEKSREIARLKDKLQYYEVVNHEMSQRNQESIENARQSRRSRQRRQRLVFLGLGAAVCVGVSVTAMYYYVPWENVKSLRNGSMISDGELPNPSSLEQAGDLVES